MSRPAWPRGLPRASDLDGPVTVTRQAELGLSGSSRSEVIVTPPRLRQRPGVAAAAVAPRCRADTRGRPLPHASHLL